MIKRLCYAFTVCLLHTAIVSASGVIEGNVSDSSSSLPIANRAVQLLNHEEVALETTFTNSSGDYSFSVPAGIYFVRIQNGEGYGGEVFNNAPCYTQSSCSTDIAEQLILADGQTLSNIDFSLNATGSISGIIIDEATGDPIPNHPVGAYLNRIFFPSVYTDLNGHYEIDDLPQGSQYFIRTSRFEGTYNAELYDDLPCSDPDCNVLVGDPVAVVANQNTSGIDFALRKTGSISGNISSETGPVINASIQIYNQNGQPVSSNLTDNSGNYHISGVSTGTYYIVASAPGYAPEVYEGLSCSGVGSCDCNPLAGNPIVVDSGADVTGIDFLLESSGKIEGRVTNESGAPLNNVEVVLSNSTGKKIANAITDHHGLYAFYGLRQGEYYLRTNNPSDEYLDEAYSDFCIGQVCPAVYGTPVLVTTGATTNINFTLERGATLKVLLVDSSTGDVVSNQRLRLFDENKISSPAIPVENQDGSRSFRGLNTGTYYLVSVDEGGAYVPEVYNDIPWYQSHFLPPDAIPIVVTSLAETIIIFDLNRAGFIEGTAVSEPAGIPIDNLWARIYDSSGHFLVRASQSEGKFRSPPLPPGNYFVSSLQSERFVDELYPDIPCPSGSCNPLQGTAVTINGEETKMLNFSLNTGSAIHGKVQSNDGRFLNSSIRIFTPDGNQAGSTFTDAFGVYRAFGLSPGNYYAAATFASDFQTEFADELFSNVPCTRGMCDVSPGTPIAVDEGSDTFNIDFELSEGGSISGVVRDAYSGFTIERISVVIFNSDGNAVGASQTFCEGAYTVEGYLAAGTYFAVAMSSDLARGYLEHRYNNAVCPNLVCSVTRGIPITVTAGQTTSNIDFSLWPEVMLKFYDVFEDETLSSGWSFKGDWLENSGQLGANASRTAKAIADPVYSGCEDCTIETSISTSGGGVVTLVGWSAGRGDQVELLMKENKNQWVLRQKAGGRIVLKRKASKQIDSNTAYRVKVVHSGSQFQVYVNGELLIDTTSAHSAQGTVGFQVKRTSAQFEEILVY